MKILQLFTSCDGVTGQKSDNLSRGEAHISKAGQNRRDGMEWFRDEEIGGCGNGIRTTCQEFETRSTSTVGNTDCSCKLNPKISSEEIMKTIYELHTNHRKRRCGPRRKASGLLRYRRYHCWHLIVSESEISESKRTADLRKLNSTSPKAITRKCHEIRRNEEFCH